MDRDRLLARLSLLGEVVAEIEEAVELPPVTLPSLPVAGDTEDDVAAEAAAAEVRRRWGLGGGPIQHVVRLLELKGLIVVRPAVDTSDVDAFSTTMRGRPIIVLASDKQDAARSRPPTRCWPSYRARLDGDAYFSLKARWGVSVAALLYRAKTLGVLSPHAYQRAQAGLSAQGWRANEPGEVGAPEEAALLQRALRLMASRCGVTPGDLAHRLRMYEGDLTSLLAGTTTSVPQGPQLQVL